jgi:arylsulfatase A-like enzyme
VIRWPGIVRAGAVENRIVSNVDFAETLLDAAGAAIPPDMQGRSLVPLLRGAAPDDWRESFYYHYYEGPAGEHHVYPHEGVTTGQAKLIHYYTLGEWELFDLEADPDELHNLADARKDDVRSLTQALADIERRHPALFEDAHRAQLSQETQDALRALGYGD